MRDQCYPLVFQMGEINARRLLAYIVLGRESNEDTEVVGKRVFSVLVFGHLHVCILGDYL